MDTNSVIGTQWVEGICSTYKQATMLAEQNLDEITTLCLWEKKKTQKETIKEEDKFIRYRAGWEITSQSDKTASVTFEECGLKQPLEADHTPSRNNRTGTS